MKWSKSMYIKENEYNNWNDLKTIDPYSTEISDREELDDLGRILLGSTKQDDISRMLRTF